MNDLNTRLLHAHETRDHWSLVSLYSEAARCAKDDDSKYFYLTHAYVFALEQNHPDRGSIYAQLAAGGRETPEG
ncbi:MAG: hypothetical protein ACU0BB_07465 [Paracoccaceae bacterium]